MGNQNNSQKIDDSTVSVVENFCLVVNCDLTGQVFIDAMQASPAQEIELQINRMPMPVREFLLR